MVQYPHIQITPEGVPVIAGTQTKVIEIVLDRLANHWDAEEIQRQYPYLGPAQIHAALTYYYDHQSELDRDIEERLKKVREIESRHGTSSIRLKLKSLGPLQ